MFRLNPNSRRLKNGKHGFSLVELIVVILIIAILAVAVFAGGSAAIKKAQKARAISDLHNFQIAVAMTMNENPQIANIEAATKKDKLSAIMNALNANLPADYKVTLQTDAMTGNISMAAQDDVNADFIICKSEKTDAWDNPYFVIIDAAQRGGSAASEFYMTTLTAGPNAILNLDGSVDKDDIFDLTSYSDGDVISEIYNIADAAPTIVGGTAAATSYIDPATSPVNNGITTAAVISASPEPAGPEPDPVSYSITTTVTNGTYTGATSIDENGVATVTISASAGYELPDTVTVTGASESYISSTGVITLSNPTGNVTITASCPVDLSAPVTNLTGTTWYFNDTIDVSELFNFSITFDSRNFSENLQTYNELMVVYDGPESPKLQYGPVLDRYVSDGQAGHWAFEACRTISITGGADATNSGLIAWLQANATRTG